MKNVQSGIMADVPRLARYLEFSLVPDEDPRPCLESLAELADGELIVVGLGSSAVAAIGQKIEGLVSKIERHYPVLTGRVRGLEGDQVVFQDVVG